MSEIDEDEGEYIPLQVVLQREGGDDEAAKATRCYALRRVSLTQAGVRWRGRRLIEFNEWTQRWEVLDIRRKARAKFEQTWSRVAKVQVDNGAEATTPEKGVVAAMEVRNKAGADEKHGVEATPAKEEKEVDDAAMQAKKRARKAHPSDNQPSLPTPDVPQYVSLGRIGL